MLDINNRNFFSNVSGLFDITMLQKLGGVFIENQEKNKIRKELSEREIKAIERGESSDEMRMQDMWYDIWKNPGKNKNILDHVSPFTYVTFPVQVRHVRKVNHKVPWHQDIGYMRVLGNKGHRQVITCFIPLEEKPYNCTTIQFADDELSKTEVKHDNMDGFGAGIAKDDLKGLKHFEQKLGDALVFGDFAIHRTFTPEGWDVERRSLEFRLIMPEDRLPNKDYFDIKLGKFIKTNENKDVING